MGVQLTFYYNAFVTVEDEDARLVFDPWTTPGILDSGWYPFFQVSDDNFEDGKETYYFASHPHPDHFDADFLLAQKGPIYVPEFNSRAASVLTGENDLRLLTPWKFQQVGPFEVACTNAFNGPDFDATFLVRHADMTFVLGSDNSPKALDLVQRCRSELKAVNVAALNYSRADDHPGMFSNLTRDEMTQVRRHKLDTAFEIFGRAVEVLEPEYVLPYAGDYIVRRERSDVHGLLGVCAPSEAIDYLENMLPAVQVLYPSHGSRWMFDRSGKLQESTSIAHSLDAPGPVPSVAWYEGGPVPRHVVRKLKGLIEKATPNLLEHVRNGKYDSFVVQARESNVCFHVGLRDGLVEQKNLSDNPKGNFVRANANLNYLVHLMNGFCDWNSAQSGLHIEWYRKDDIYDGDFYSGLFSFKA